MTQDDVQRILEAYQPQWLFAEDIARFLGKKPSAVHRNLAPLRENNEVRYRKTLKVLRKGVVRPVYIYSWKPKQVDMQVSIVSKGNGFIRKGKWYGKSIKRLE